MRFSAGNISKWLLRTVFHWLLWSAVVLAGVLVYARYIEPATLSVSEVRVASRVAERQEPTTTYRIAFFSDLDLQSPPGRFERRLRDRVNALEPDMVAFGGDFTGGDGKTVQPDLAEAIGDWLAGFEAPDGVWVAWGEQDYVNRETLRSRFRNSVHVVHDRSVIREIDGVGLRICGPGGLFPLLWVDEAAGWLRATWGPSRVLSRYLGTGAEAWSGIDVTAHIRLYRPGDSVGLAVMEGGPRPGYRFRVYPERNEWAMVQTQQFPRKGSTRDKKVAVTPRQSYLVRIRVEPGEEDTRVRSKIWPASEDQPEDWPIDFSDRRPAGERPDTGTLALVAGGEWETSNRQGWDWIHARSLDGETLMTDDFGDPERFAADWDNPGGRPDQVDATLVIGHDPRDFAGIPEDAWSGSLDLILAGHTHGGQVRLPLFGPLYMDRGVPREWSRGLVKLSHGRARMYVTRGIGVSQIPVRFLCSPEITLLSLELAPQASR